MSLLFFWSSPESGSAAAKFCCHEPIFTRQPHMPGKIVATMGALSPALLRPQRPRQPRRFQSQLFARQSCKVSVLRKLTVRLAGPYGAKTSMPYFWQQMQGNRGSRWGKDAHAVL